MEAGDTGPSAAPAEAHMGRVRKITDIVKIVNIILL